MTMSSAPPGPVVMLIQSFHPLIGGAERQALQLAAALRGEGIDVRVVTRHLPGTPRREEIAGVPVLRLRAPGPRPVSTACFLLGSLAWLLLDAPAGTLIHVHLAASHAVGAALAGRLRGLPVLVKIGGAAGIGEIGAAAATLGGRLKLAALRRLRPRFIALNEDHVAELRRALGAGARVELIPNGVDVARHHPAEPGERERRARDLGLQGLALVSVGRLADDKGQLTALATMLDAWPAFLEKHPGARFLLAGEGPARARVLEDIRRRGLESSVILLGRRDDVPELLRAADGFVLLSVAEGMSNALLEAMATGLPVIAPKVSGVTGLVEDGVHGALFDPRRADEAGRALRWLADDPARARAAGQRGRAAAEERSLDRVARLYLDLYRRAASAP